MIPSLRSTLLIPLLILVLSGQGLSQGLVLCTAACNGGQSGLPPCCLGMEHPPQAHGSGALPLPATPLEEGGGCLCQNCPARFSGEELLVEPSQKLEPSPPPWLLTVRLPPPAKPPQAWRARQPDPNIPTTPLYTILCILLA